jgi:hypothetical protein
MIHDKTDVKSLLGKVVEWRFGLPGAPRFPWDVSADRPDDAIEAFFPQTIDKEIGVLSLPANVAPNAPGRHGPRGFPRHRSSTYAADRARAAE